MKLYALFSPTSWPNEFKSKTEGGGLWIWGSGNRLEMEPNTATRPDSRRIPPRAQGSNELGGFQLCNPQELHWIAVKLCLFVCWGEEDNNVQQRRSFQLPIPAITKHQSYIFNFGLSLSCPKFLLFIIYELNSVRHCFSLLLVRSLHRTSSSLFFFINYNSVF